MIVLILYNNLLNLSWIKECLFFEEYPFPSISSLQVSDGTHTVRHDSVISVFGGFLYGMEDMETYGMVSGLRLSPVNEVCGLYCKS